LSANNRLGPKEVLIFTSTPNEYRSVSGYVGRQKFEKLAPSVINCGAGRIHATFSVANELTPRLAANTPPIAMVGAGTSGSLSLHLKQGDVIVSNSAIITDWRMENEDEVLLSPYGVFEYLALDPPHLEKMVIECRHPLIVGLMEKLPPNGFQRGRLLTSEAFVSGKTRKLKLGSDFGCLACDMESGVYGHLGNRLVNVPWFNVRVVADTLDETLGDYFAKERDMTDILAQKIVEILQIFDSSLDE
jgi:nucleoside phosphorylase